MHIFRYYHDYNQTVTNSQPRSRPKNMYVSNRGIWWPTRRHRLVQLEYRWNIQGHSSQCRRHVHFESHRKELALFCWRHSIAFRERHGKKFCWARHPNLSSAAHSIIGQPQTFRSGCDLLLVRSPKQRHYWQQPILWYRSKKHKCTRRQYSATSIRAHHHSNTIRSQLFTYR